MKSILFIFRNDLKQMLRERETLIWLFVMPIVFIFFIGNVTGGGSFDGSSKQKLAVELPDDAGPLGDQLALRLGERDFTLVPPDSAEFTTVVRRLTVPAAFTDSVRAGHQTELVFTGANDGLTGDLEKLRIDRAVYTLLADVIAATSGDSGLTAASLAQLNALPRTLRIESVPAGERQLIPSGFEQTVPGIMVMFTLLIMGTSGAILLVVERRQGLLRRLAYTPISRSEVVLGKWSAKFAIGLVQIAFAMLAGTLLFGMQWGQNLLAIFAVMIAYGALTAGLGMVLGSVAKTEGMAAGIGVVSANVLGALGGCWWPIEVAPAWMQKLQLLLPTGWAMDALHKLISFGYGPLSVVPHLIVLTVGAVVLLVVAGRVFRFE